MFGVTESTDGRFRQVLDAASATLPPCPGQNQKAPSALPTRDSIFKMHKVDGYLRETEQFDGFTSRS
jgi:hypothetical protein